MLQKRLAEVGHWDGIDLIHMDRFITGSIAAAYTFDITARNLRPARAQSF